MTDGTVRRLGALAECLHAVVYFAPENEAAYRALGLKGYWMGYVASRSAALGAAGPEQVTRLFGGFAPERIARALPDAWDIATPQAVLAARGEAATAALRRLLGDLDVSTAAAALAQAVAGLDLAGRPLAAAHARAFAAAPGAGPVACLWQAATVLREYRGDAHLQAVAEAGLRWPEPHLLLAATGRLDPRQQDLRGWDDDAWAAARERVRSQPAGAHEWLDARTDHLAGVAGAAELCAVLEAPALAVLAGGGVPFPNAMGLADPRPGAA